MRVVVTGGSGLVGQVTSAALKAAGHEVVIMDPVAPPASGTHFIRANAGDYEALLEACRGADAIAHLAAIPQPTNRPAHVVHNNNVTSSYNVLCVAAELGINRVIMASSVNAIGLTWSRTPRFDYFPVDEQHRTRNEDPYSLSKWIAEQQADSVVRAHPQMSVASLRLHMFMPDRHEADRFSHGEWVHGAARGLWGYTTHRMWVDACLGALNAEFTGHEVFFIVADRAVGDDTSDNLARTWYPDVELRKPLSGDMGFFDCAKAEALLGWSGADDPAETQPL